MEKIKKEELKKYVVESTKTVHLMDEFEGIGDKNNIIYDRLIIKNYRTGFTKKGKLFHYRLVVERRNGREKVGNITFTKFKKGEDGDLIEYISNQISNQVIKRYKNTGKIYYFEKPYLLRAQNSRNRTGYGWEWDWSGGIGISYEGTLYGETTSYVFAGVLIE